MVRTVPKRRMDLRAPHPRPLPDYWERGWKAGSQELIRLGVWSSNRRPLLRRNQQRQLIPSAQDHDLFRFAGALFRQQLVQLIHTLDGRLREFDDDIAVAQSRAGGGAAGLDLDDHHASVGGEVVEADDPPLQGDVLPAEADVAAFDAAEAEKLGGDEDGGVTGDGETEALCGADDGGVDADDFAAAVDQRSAAVAGVQGGIRLDDVVDEASACRAEASRWR